MSRQRFAIILEGMVGAIAIAFTILLSPLLRGWYRRWGTTGDEAQRALPGDAITPEPRSDMTCAVAIQAAPAQVWPWLAQIGCGRAGWYSYDWLDNGGRESARRILPDHQNLALGDTVSATPDGRVRYPVAALEPGHYLILGGTLDTRTGQAAELSDPNLTAYFSGSNLFYLDETTPGTTRLIYRLRLGWNPTWLNTLAYRVFLEPISFIMARKMLLGIKERVEIG